MGGRSGCQGPGRTGLASARLPVSPGLEGERAGSVVVVVVVVANDFGLILLPDFM